MSAEIIPFERPELTVPENQPKTALAPTIRFIHVTNVLMPTVSRRESALPWESAKTVAAYVEEQLPAHEKLVVSLNGRILSTEEREHIVPRAGDYIVVSPHLAGGSVWRTLSQVAVMAAAVAASVFLGPEFVALGWAATATMGSVMAGIAAGIISVGGNLLINALMPLQPSSRAQSPSWAFEGPKTLAQPGVVIPKGYGTFLSGGNVIASFVDIEGSDQYINALVCYGFGPARSISGIQINGKDIYSYQNVAYYLRMGSNNQTAIPSFNRIVNGYPQDVQVLCASGSVVVPGTGDLTQALQVDVQFPQGVYYISGDGNQLPCKVVYKVEYSVTGSGVWQAVLQPRTTVDVVIYHTDGSVDTSATPKWGLVWTGCAPGSGILLTTDNGPHTPGDPQSVTETITTYNADGSDQSYSATFQGEWQPIDTSLNQIKVTDWMEGWVQYVNDTTQAVYNRTSIYGLAPNKYDVRVTKWGSNNADNTVQSGDYDSPKRGQEVWIHSVNEITYQDLSYPNMILVGVRALATNQLSGADINITAVIEYGLRSLDLNILPAALQAFEEDNPACVAADMMLDPLYGGGSYPGILPTNIERFIDEWTAWAENSDTLVPDGNGNSIRLAVFNGVFDSDADLWSQLQNVGRMSRASIIPLGRDYGVFVQTNDVPVQMFSVGNIKQDSFEETWLALDDRANQVEVEFADSTRYYRTDNPLVYMDPADQAAGVIVKNVRVKGTGITVPAQAWHLGHFLGVCNKLLLRTGKIECDADAIACRPGNLVILQHDVPQWGWGGRTMPAAVANQVTVDRNDLPWDGVTAYNLIVLFPSIQRYAGTVSAVSTSIDSTGLTIGTLLSLSSFDNSHRVTRAVVAGVDCPILQSTAGQVLVTLPAGFTPTVGQAYTLYDTDVLETATVSGVAPSDNNSQTLTLGAPFTQAPADFSVYFYGQPGSQKIVRVTNIRRMSNERRAIEWIDEDPNVYTVGTPIVGETSALVTTNPGVTNLTGAEVFELQSGSYIDYASLTWKNGPNTEGVSIFGSYPGLLAPKMLARLTGRATAWKYQIAPGVAWTFTVVGFDASDNYAAFATAPSVSITALGITTNLLQDSSFQSGFAYWNLTPRAGDTIVPTFQNDGEAEYTVNGSALTVVQYFVWQPITSAAWAAAVARAGSGMEVMLSVYFEMAGTPTGNIVGDLLFYDSTGAWISSARAVLTLTGAAQSLTRVNTGVVAVPSGTASVTVGIRVDGSLNFPVGTVCKFSHLLLEVLSSGQTTPSAWADIDVKGNVLDIFEGGSSSGLRTQGSTLPTYSGSFSYSSTANSLTISWTGLAIAWPDGGASFIQDGSITVTGLSASTTYYAYLYFDVVNGGIKAIYPASGTGTPAILTTAINVTSDQACKQDGRVALTPGGLSMATTASGTTGGGTGGGAGGGGFSGGPSGYHGVNPN